MGVFELLQSPRAPDKSLNMSSVLGVWGTDDEEEKGEGAEEGPSGGLQANMHENILSRGGMEKLTRLIFADISSNGLVSADVKVLIYMYV